MSRMYGGSDLGNMFPNEQTLVINRRNELIKSLFSINGDESRLEDVKMVCQHVYDLAMMGHRQLEPDMMTRFIERSNRILAKMVQS